MGIPTTELAIQRRITKEFIGYDSVVVVLQRSTRVSDGAGGYLRQSPVSLPPQVMRLIPLSDRGAAAQRLTADGKMAQPNYILMAEYSADLMRWDTFALNGERYDVLWVNQNTQYEKKAEVIYRGQ
jgi:hypothetical protein